jgi:hypothetical protein
MLAVTLVAGVVAVGVSVAVMSSETTEKAKTKADIKYLEAKAPFNFGKDRASVDNFKKLRDDRLIEALRDPRVDLQFVKDLSDEQIGNMVKYAGTADVILGMPETQRLSLVDKLSGHLVGANAKVAATVLSISSRPSVKMTNDDGVRWAEVLRQLLELHERAQPDIRGNVQNQIEVILKTDPEMNDVPRTFVEFGTNFLKHIRHDALAHVLHAYDNSSVSKLYTSPALKAFNKVDIDMVERNLGSRGINDPIAVLMQRIVAESSRGPSNAIVIQVEAAIWDTGVITKVLSGDFKDVNNKDMGKIVVDYDESSRRLEVQIKDIHKYILTESLRSKEMNWLRNTTLPYDDCAKARDDLVDAGFIAPPQAKDLTDATTLRNDAVRLLRDARSQSRQIKFQLEKVTTGAFARPELVNVELTKY